MGLAASLHPHPKGKGHLSNGRFDPAGPLYKNIYTVLNTIIGGYYNTKYVGIGPYSKVISFNRLEGARFQIGARTTKEFSRRVRLSTYLAYGTRDEDFKGAAEVELMLRRQLLRKLTVTYRNDAIQLSSGVSALSENNILSSIFSRGGTSRLSTIEEGIALYEHEWLHGISSSFELRGRHISSNRYVPMILPDGRSLHGINDASIRIGLRLSKDETIVRMPFEVRHMGSKYPIFSFDFTGAKEESYPPATTTCGSKGVCNTGSICLRSVTRNSCSKAARSSARFPTCC